MNSPTRGLAVRFLAWALLACFAAGANPGLAQEAARQGTQTFESVLNPNAAEQAKRQQTQPGNNAPVWRDVRSEKEHYTTARGPEAGVLIQSGGETWRERRNPVFKGR